MSDDKLGRFEIIVPEPGEILKAQVIHPDNAAIQSEGDSYIAFILPKNQHKTLNKEQRRLHGILTQAGYFQAAGIISDAANRWREIMARRAEIMNERQAADPQQVHDLKLEWQSLNNNLESLKRETVRWYAIERKHSATALQLADIELRLHQHSAALARQEAYNRARAKLEQESRDFHDIIIQALTGLGLCYRWSYKGKEYTRRVQIAERYPMLDAHYYKIFATSKGMFGWRWHLPRGVNPNDIIKDETLAALTVACERQVEGIRSPTGAIYLRVNRLGVTDGLVEKVTYAQMMATYPADEGDKIPLPIGIKQGLMAYWAGLTEYPHILVAGSSGSGKSNLLRLWIATMTTLQGPEAVRLFLVDLKDGQEFAIYEDSHIPHLAGVIKTPPQFLNLLAQLEMLRVERVEKMRKYYAAKLEDYNARVPKDEQMARIVVIIDEFAAIYMSDPFDLENENKRIATQIKALVRQLLAKARSVGIQLIISTQTPYVEILPGIDKANVAMKIVGRFIDPVVSRTILGNKAAAEIPESIKGRMIVQTSGTMFMVQVPFVSDEERMEAIKQALLYEVAPDIALPALPERENKAVRFTVEELVELSLSEFGGNLSVRKLWTDSVKHTGRITYDGLTEMVKLLGAEGTVVHQDQIYKVTKSTGQGYVLKADVRALAPVNQSQGENF